MYTTIIKSYIEKLDVSKPIFNLTLSEDADAVRSAQCGQHKYKPTIDENDPVSTLVAIYNNESFHIHEAQYRLNRDSIENSVIDAIIRGFVDFLSRNLPNKDPGATKIHKWVRKRLKYKYDAHDNCTLLYRYMRQHTDENMAMLTGSNKEHATNIIALLEAMKEKYGE